MVDKMKTDVDWLLLVSKMKKKVQFHQIYQPIFFSLSKPKVVYLRPFLSSLLFSKLWKQNVMYFAHKHVETRPNCSREIPIFSSITCP